MMRCRRSSYITLVVVDSASLGDRIGIVAFNDNATAFLDARGYLFQANQENKDSLKQSIRQLNAAGGSSFYDAFDLAFDVLDRTAQAELLDCTTAIVMLTDGENKDELGRSEEDVIALFRNRSSAMRAATGHAVILFT